MIEHKKDFFKKSFFNQNFKFFRLIQIVHFLVFYSIPKVFSLKLPKGLLKLEVEFQGSKLAKCLLMLEVIFVDVNLQELTIA